MLYVTTSEVILGIFHPPKLLGVFDFRPQLFCLRFHRLPWFDSDLVSILIPEFFFPYIFSPGFGGPENPKMKVPYI